MNEEKKKNKNRGLYMDFPNFFDVFCIFHMLADGVGDGKKKVRFKTI